MYKTFVILVALQITITLAAGNTFDTIWSLSCQFSTIVSRSKREIELPDIYNAKETFDYLFPLANVQPQEFNQGGARSNSVPSLSSWLDDIWDLWRHDCQQRRRDRGDVKKQKRRKRRKRNVQEGISYATQAPRMNGNDEITWAGYLGNYSSTYDMYLGPPREVDDGDVQVEDGSLEDEEEEHIVGEDDEGNYWEEEDSEETEETTTTTEKSKKENATETTTTTTTTPAPTTTAAPEPDSMFASYGGDIEYFFPILSFTIPWDGQITLLGFHGFKGMFVY